MLFFATSALLLFSNPNWAGISAVLSTLGVFVFWGVWVFSVWGVLADKASYSVRFFAWRALAGGLAICGSVASVELIGSFVEAQSRVDLAAIVFGLLSGLILTPVAIWFGVFAVRFANPRQK
ncbi:hypothetical protein V0U79_01955 [Hyphobacterium sp. HN65]|uniref:GtrA-like protein domain-containing protein n=1 Tax=Hyphobacterium lacteum TaxID=3116575 RepID=A0ABU7LMG0_9PROT|nr:hypothetical protein [Hyphobacterium sp. HN65]MEE2525112.1 hypothetical protein [Hyphobacterium sp. HN65]